MCFYNYRPLRKSGHEEARGAFFVQIQGSSPTSRILCEVHSLISASVLFFVFKLPRRKQEAVAQGFWSHPCPGAPTERAPDAAKVHVPRSRRKRSNLGYAFVNFSDPAFAAQAVVACRGQPLGGCPTERGCNVEYSSLQGEEFLRHVEESRAQQASAPRRRV